MTLNITSSYTDVLGAHEIGAVIASALFGMVTLQTFTYYRTYSKDSRCLKVMVGLVWTMLLAHTILAVYSLFRRTISQFGQAPHAAGYPDGICEDFAIQCVVVVIVQSFFAYRLRKLSGAIIIPIICWIFSGLRLAALITISVAACRSNNLRDFSDHWRWLAYCALSVSAFIDFLITASLSYFLWIRRKDVLQHAQQMIDKLILWAIQTSVVTSLFSLIVLFVIATMKSLIWLAPFLPMAGVFAASLLASLNARKTLRTYTTPSQPSIYDLTPTPMDIPCSHSRSSPDNITRILAQNVSDDILPRKNSKDIELGTVPHS